MSELAGQYIWQWRIESNGRIFWVHICLRCGTAVTEIDDGGTACRSMHSAWHDRTGL